MPKRLVCPLCGERYEVGAAQCRFCGATSDYRFPDRDPAKGTLGEILMLAMVLALFVMGLAITLL
jgi:hypothetical protein